MSNFQGAFQNKTGYSRKSNSPPSVIHAVHIRFTKLKTRALIQTISGFARWARGKINSLSSTLLRQIDSRSNQRRAHTLTTGSLIYNHVLYPCTPAGRDLERNQGEHTQDWGNA